jgi:TolB-like protein/Tfp pilus assembly protein PilF
VDSSSFARDSTRVPTQASNGAPSAPSVAAALERLLASACLRDSHLLRRFLRYSVERTLAGEGERLKEYCLAIEVFGRDASYDPRVDPVVRMSARRLRQKLQEYYAHDGASEPVQIEIPKGGYSAVFHATPQAVAQATGAVVSANVEGAKADPFTRGPLQKLRWMAGAVLSVLFVCAMVWWMHGARVQAAGTGKTLLAVMPFVNLSGDPQEEYVSDGLTEEFINRLGTIDPQRLGIIARTSVMGYKNTRKHVDEIGRELGVRYLLEGSVRRSGSRVRITAQLVQATDQAHLWSQSYDGDSHDLLELDGRVGEAAAREVTLHLGHVGPGMQLTEASPQANAQLERIDPEAHELYLQGRYFWSKRSYRDILKGLDYFQRAVGVDPNYAMAYVGIADAYGMLAANDQAPAADVVPKAREAALRALQIDPGLAEGHAALAHIKFFYDWDFPAAEAEYRRALNLNPDSADGHHFYGVMLMWTGRLNEAAEQLRDAEVLDPLSSVNSAALGLAYLYSGKAEAAIQQARKALETAPDDAIPHALLGMCFESQKRYPQAVEEMQKAVALSNRDSETLGWLGWVLALEGRRAEAEKIIAELQSVPSERYSATHDVAIIYAGLGDNERALRYLDESVSRREADALDMKVELAWQAVRSDARFQALLRRSGLLVDSG